MIAVQQSVKLPNTYMYGGPSKYLTTCSVILETRSSRHFFCSMGHTSLPKITQLHCASFSQQNVLRLHVSVQNSVRVQIIQCLDQLTGNSVDL